VTRASYGVALVLAPGLVSYLATGHLPSRRARRVAQLLGTRHLAQTAITAAVPVPDVFALGTAVDTAHAASMVMLAPASGTAWPAALLDALAEAVFAAAGFRCGRAAGR
jgi:ethanolamine utilization microcompartment shell protein EutL